MEPIKSEENGILDPKKEAATEGAGKASVPGSNNGMLAAMLLDKKPDQETTHVVNGHADFKKMNGGTAEAGKGKAD